MATVARPAAAPALPSPFALHAALTQTGETVGITTMKPTAAFRPHLSIAYHNRPRPAAEVTEAVAPLRALPGVDVTVADVLLVELRRDGRQYQW